MKILLVDNFGSENIIGNILFLTKNVAKCLYFRS
jgi:hypothetical protein